MSGKVSLTDVPIVPAIAGRWSPVCFDPDRPVADADLAALLEAARWAPSAYNEQPWRFLLARRSDTSGFETMLSCLADANQVWARHAPVLLLAMVVRTMTDGRPNRMAEHDLGLATANLLVEATARGLYVHPMGGIRPERICHIYRLPEDILPLTALAVGYLGDGRLLPEAVRARDHQPRARKPLRAFVFEHQWGTPARLQVVRQRTQAR